jgi:hypothetical protein
MHSLASFIERAQASGRDGTRNENGSIKPDRHIEVKGRAVRDSD